MRRTGWADSFALDNQSGMSHRALAPQTDAFFAQTFSTVADLIITMEDGVFTAAQASSMLELTAIAGRAVGHAILDACRLGDLPSAVAALAPGFHVHISPDRRH